MGRLPRRSGHLVACPPGKRIVDSQLPWLESYYNAAHGGLAWSHCFMSSPRMSARPVGLTVMTCGSARKNSQRRLVQVKPEGLCRGDICVPVPSSRASDYVSHDALNASAFWRRMGHPVVHDAGGEAWVLGTRAADRTSALTSLEAPDFALPDLAGTKQSLSEHRGKKVLLATWASW